MAGRSRSYSKAFLEAMILELHGGLSIARFCCPAAALVIIDMIPLSQVFVTVDNAAQFTHNGRTAEIVGGAAVPLRQGESHAIYNHTDKETRWFNFNVTAIGMPADSTDFGDDRADAPLESLDRLPVARLDRNLLGYGQSARR